MDLTQTHEQANCKLCGNDVTLLCEDKRRQFYLCDNCELVFVPEKFLLSVEDERKRYDLHDNTIDNAGYVKYLSQVTDVVKDSFSSDVKILDYGCGENAVLCKLLNDKGYNCACYDPLYNYVLDDDVNVKYDVVILCEVIEHLRNITEVFAHIKNLLRDNGAIIIRTQLYDDLQTFPTWWYAQDPTHINFFNNKSLDVLADNFCNANVRKTECSDIFIVKTIHELTHQHPQPATNATQPSHH